MDNSLNISGVNQLPRGANIYQEGSEITSVSLLVKGRVMVQTKGLSTLFNVGNFLGALNLDTGVHSFTYEAYDDVVLYTFPVHNDSEFEEILKKKSEYRGLLNTSLNFFIKELNKLAGSLRTDSNQLKDFIETTYQLYHKFGKDKGIYTADVTQMDNLSDIFVQKEVEHPCLRYYLQAVTIPVEAQKAYYAGDVYVCQEHLKQQRAVVFDLLEEVRDLANMQSTMFGLLITDELSLFNLMSKLAVEYNHKDIDSGDLLARIDQVIAKVNEVETFLIKKAGLSVNLNREYMERMYFSILSKEDYDVNDDDDDTVDLSILASSMDQIFSYAQQEYEDTQTFKRAFEIFCSWQDKSRRDEDTRVIRKELITTYYRIYRKVLEKLFRDPQPPLAIRLFIKFGFISEKLLTEDQLADLISWENTNEMNGPCHIYTMDEWLKEIYSTDKLPSKSEFDIDYEEKLRERKRNKEITDKEERQLLSDKDEKLTYEINNAFIYNNRVVNGQITAFVPFLYSEECFMKIKSALLTADRINEIVASIIDIDFTLFKREELVSYPDLGITKEQILVDVYPDIILCPTYGRNGIMWQEASGRKYNTKARFFFPIMFEGNIEQEVVKVLGKFRWEMCRRIQGVHWNNIQSHSLTSEYYDYLQFYRKNKDLSPAWREKIKQMQSGGSKNSRDLFARDYSDWVLRESQGLMRLNKVVRDILYTYCPFNRAVREKLSAQGMYKEASKRFLLQRNKDFHRLDAEIKRIERMNEEVPSDIKETYDFYRTT